ncbi:MAG: hypothetical protein ACI4QL_00865 [Candidatus Fimimonas sp.]
MNEQNNKFSYTYSVPTENERREIESIRKNYLSEKPSKLALLRKLHAKVKNTATAVAISVGIVGLLVFGLGMAMVLQWGLIAAGIAISVVGCAVMGFAKKIYDCVFQKQKAKYGEEILKLSEQLLNEQQSNN